MQEDFVHPCFWEGILLSLLPFQLGFSSSTQSQIPRTVWVDPELVPIPSCPCHGQGPLPQLRGCSGTADPAQLPSPDTSLQLKLLISLVAGLCCRRKNGFSLGLCCRRKKGAGLSLKGGRRDRDFCGHWLNEELKLTPGALSLQKQQTHPVSEP